MTLLRRVVLFALATASMLVGIAAGQKSVNERLDHALADLKANRLDSAEALLRPVLDSATRATTEERAAAWFLAGVIAFYQSDDSGSAADFRAALSRTLMLNGEWLKGLDPHLAVIMQDARGRAPSGSGKQVPHYAVAGNAPFSQGFSVRLLGIKQSLQQP